MLEKLIDLMIPSVYLMAMGLPSAQLDAFMEIAKRGGFSPAAKHLNISQSALSQRIKNLEEELSLTLFVRTPTGVLLTEQGARLLKYCQTRNALEEELAQELNASGFFEMAGTIRIGGYSSVFRSVMIPSLTGILRRYPKILIEFVSRSMDDLPEMLQRAEVDMIVMDYTSERSDLQAEVLGHEKFVVIESKKCTSRDDIFLDNDSQDRATEMFFRKQKGKLPKYRRSYFTDCYGIIDGVRAGLGKAVMSEHLVKDDNSLRIVEGYKAHSLDVVLHYHRQPFYSKLHQAIVSELKSNANQHLG